MKARLPASLGPCPLPSDPSGDPPVLLPNPIPRQPREEHGHSDTSGRVEGHFEEGPGARHCPQSHMQTHFGARFIVECSLMEVEASPGNAGRPGIRTLSFVI